jgi:hypothetical protein
MIQLILISVSQVFIQVENRVIELITLQNNYNRIKYLIDYQSLAECNLLTENCYTITLSINI